MNVTYTDSGEPTQGTVTDGPLKAEVDFTDGVATIEQITTTEIDDGGRQRGYVHPEYVTGILSQLRALPFVDSIDAFGLGVDA